MATLEAKMSELEQMAQQMASYAYQQQGGAGASDANAGTANAQDDNVVDADSKKRTNHLKPRLCRLGFK